MKIRKELLSVNLNVSWISVRSGRIHLVNLKKTSLATGLDRCVKSTYSVGLAPRIPVVAGLRHDIGDVHIVDEIVRVFKYRPDKSG